MQTDHDKQNLISKIFCQTIFSMTLLSKQNLLSKLLNNHWWLVSQPIVKWELLKWKCFTKNDSFEQLLIQKDFAKSIPYIGSVMSAFMVPPS